MLFKQNKNLLPKDLADGVAPKTQNPQHQLSRFRGLRKRLIFFRNSKCSRIVLGSALALFLTGYQPTLAIPPIKQSVAAAEADFTQEQSITPADFADIFVLPHPGYLTTRFSTWHPGIDIATGLSMPLHPIAKGKVVETSFGFWGLGHYIVIEHEQGFKSTYGHMGKIYSRVGDSVESSSIVGTVGMTGRTTGPHTHLEITKDGRYIDPLTILPSISNWPATAGEAPYGASDNKPETKAETKPQVTSKTPVLTFTINDIKKAEQKKEKEANDPLQSHLQLLQLGRI